MAQAGKGNEDLKNQLAQRGDELSKAPTVKSMLELPEYNKQASDQHDACPLIPKTISFNSFQVNYTVL